LRDCPEIHYLKKTAYGVGKGGGNRKTIFRSEVRANPSLTGKY